MQSEGLPEFQRKPTHLVMVYINKIFTREGRSGSQVIELKVYPDNHFRAIFRSSYFELSEPMDLPSKSQWSTLKKKLKRHDRSVFVFRETGELNCSGFKQQDGEFRCLFIDFGFYKY
ncbi:hypothetical protein MASR2M15_02210 [Anaerolineales bacterium]